MQPWLWYIQCTKPLPEPISHFELIQQLKNMGCHIWFTNSSNSTCVAELCALDTHHFFHFCNVSRPSCQFYLFVKKMYYLYSALIWKGQFLIISPHIISTLTPTLVFKDNRIMPSLPHWSQGMLAASKARYRPVTMSTSALITRFMGPKWGPPWADRTQVGLMLAPWTFAVWVVTSKQMAETAKSPEVPIPGTELPSVVICLTYLLCK